VTLNSPVLNNNIFLICGHLFFKYGFLNYESGVCMSSVIEKVLSSKLGEVENNF
jgi:hypothetical protein